MALTITNRDPESRVDVKGSRRMAQFKVTFDSSYPTGGEAITASQFGMQRIHSVLVAAVSTSGHKVLWDASNSKLKVYCAGGTTQASSTGDLSAESVDVIVIGV